MVSVNTMSPKPIESVTDLTEWPLVPMLNPPPNARKNNHTNDYTTLNDKVKLKTNLDKDSRDVIILTTSKELTYAKQAKV